MSTQPQPAPEVSKEVREKLLKIVSKPSFEELLNARKKAERRADILYVAGAVLVTIGMGMARMRYGFITAGAFCVLLPLMELVSGFIKGLRAPRSRI